MEPAKKSLEDLLKDHLIYEIPFFQRTYVWEEEEWDRFLEDMQYVSEEKEAEYFMGSFILKSHKYKKDADMWKKTVVDGQQRLTTILVFLKVLQEAGQGSEKIKFINKHDDPILIHNFNDREIFEKILSGIRFEKLKSYSKDSKFHKILRCYAYFRSCFSIGDESDYASFKFGDINKVDSVDSIDADDIIKKLFFVTVTLDEKDNEQQIFDTMNSLGVSLTTGELLKNELFNQEDEESEKIYLETWQKAFVMDSVVKDFWDTEIVRGREKRTHMDIFLQSFLLIKDENYGEGKYKRMEKLFAIYKNFISTKCQESQAKEAFIYELIDYANHYRENITNEILLDEERSFEDGLKVNPLTQRLNVIMFGLNRTTVIPYVLYILKEISDQEEQKRMFKLLEIYLMRRAITKETTKNYNRIFASYVKNKVNSYEELKKELYKEIETSRMPNKHDMKVAFLESKITDSAVAKFTLLFLEYKKREYLGLDNQTSKLLSCSNYNIEHVMPKKWDKNDDWKAVPYPASYDEKSEQEKIDARKHALNQMGNLTILAPKLNIKISNAGWIKKKDGEPAKGRSRVKPGLKDCCADLRTFSSYLGKGIWDEYVIDERGAELLETAEELWPYDPPSKGGEE